MKKSKGTQVENIESIMAELIHCMGTSGEHDLLSEKGQGFLYGMSSTGNWQIMEKTTLIALNENVKQLKRHLSEEQNKNITLQNKLSILDRKLNKRWWQKEIKGVLWDE